MVIHNDMKKESLLCYFSLYNLSIPFASQHVINTSLLSKKIKERNNVTFTTNPTRRSVIQPRSSNLNDDTNTYTRENPQTFIPNTNNNPPIPPTENQPPPSNKKR